MDSKLFLKALKGQKTDKTPIWLMRQAGRYLPEYRKLREQAGSFLDLCYTPDFAVEVTLQPLRRFNLDAAILFADILLLPQALGQDLSFREGEGPVLTPIRSVEEVAALKPEAVHDRLAPVYETVERLSREIPSSTALIGFAGAPWTVATYMVEGGGSSDHATTKRWAYSDPDGFQKLIDLLVESTAAYLLRQIEAGAEAVQIFDTWAGALPEPAFRRWCIEPARAIASQLRSAHPEISIIGFPKGAGESYRDYAAETGVDGLSIDTAVPVDWAARVLQPNAAIQGNLDPQMLVVGGEAMDRDAVRILDGLSGGPHIFNLGHGIVPQTPPENVARLVEVVRNWRP